MPFLQIVLVLLFALSGSLPKSLYLFFDAVELLIPEVFGLKVSFAESFLNTPKQVPRFFVVAFNLTLDFCQIVLDAFFRFSSAFLISCFNSLSWRRFVESN